jgi:predicted CXXCH cytochrome family protein
MPHEEPSLEHLANVPPDAHRRRDPIARAQVLLPLLVLLGVGAFWGVDQALQGEERYTAGPLATAHASWEQNCTVCHVSAQPLGATNWLAVTLQQTHVADAACQQCHAGPIHHESQRRAEVAGCTSCHREHQGRRADLVRVADAHCTRCHDNLDAHLHGQTKSKYESFQGGFANHPEFQILRKEEKDPGQVEFNHKLHMMPGLRKQLDSSVPFTLADLPTEWRERYRRPGQTEKGPLQLECASCHRLDATSAVAGLPQPARPSGAYMLPVTYEQHCQACHPLHIESKMEKDRPAQRLTLRHRQQPAEIHTLLEGYYLDQFVKGALIPSDPRQRPLPGKLPLTKEDKQLAQALIVTKVAQAEKLAFGKNTCQECHRSLDPNKGAQQRIATADIPMIWYKHARFDHVAHRAVHCRECHPRAYALTEDGTVNANASRHKDDVLLPGLATCQQCHAPAQQVGGQRRGGARFDCVECHRYHGGDAPLHGRGAVDREAVQGRRVSIQEFLTGPSR